MFADLCLSGIVYIESLGFSQSGRARSSWKGGVSPSSESSNV